MVASFSDMVLSVAYLLAWVLTLFFYQKKRNVFDGGSVIMLSYASYAVFSIITLNDVFFSSMFVPLRLFPYIYLYIMLMLALSPSIYHHLHPVEKIEDPHTRILKLTGWMVCVSAFFLVPDIVGNFTEGLVMLFTDTEAGQDAYSEQLGNADEAGVSVSNLFAIVYNAFADVGIFLFYYFLSRKDKDKCLVVGLGCAIIIGLLIPVMHGQRSGVILSILTLVLGYFLFKEFFSRTINRVVRWGGIAVLALTALPVVAITLSRFDKMMAGVLGFLNWYIGQANIYFNNWGLDAGGIRYGDRTLNLFKRLVFPDTPANFVERRDKYHNLELDDYYFSTFVGDFTIDFGPYLALLIFLAFNASVCWRIRRKGNVIKVHQLLLLYLSMCICMQGGMYLFAYADTANLRIVTLMGLYVYLCYHEKLLEKYPLIKK